MTRDELDDIIRTLPGVKARWTIPRDLATVLAIEAVTFGKWDEKVFRSTLRRPDTIMRVAVCKETERPRAFAVYRVEDFTDGTGTMTVVNFAASDPVARHGMISELNRLSRKHNRRLLWTPPSY